MTMLDFFEAMVAAMQGTVAGLTLLTAESLPFLLMVILFLIDLFPAVPDSPQ